MALSSNGAPLRPGPLAAGEVAARGSWFAELITPVATAALVWFGLGLDPWWPLVWFAPLPALLLVLRGSWMRAAAVAFIGWFAGSCSLWPYLRLLHTPPAVLAGYLISPAVMFALAIVLFRTSARRRMWWRALWSVPACWVSAEYLRTLVWPHGTAGSVAYTQLDFAPLLQLAAVTGPWGIGFVVFLCPTALALGFHLRPIDPRSSRRMVVAGLGLVAVVIASGTFRLAQTPAQATVTVGLVASDHIGEEPVAREGAPTEHRLRAYTREAASLARRGAGVIVLPEKLGLVTPTTVGAIDALFQDVTDRTGATIVVGVVEVVAGRKFNRARIYARHSSVASYDKQHLLPQFEPGLQTGRTPTLLSREPAPWGVAICKDLDFAAPARRYGEAGAGLLLVPAWDFGLDRRWHGHIAIMRGVENGCAVARASREGNLTVSDRCGRIVAERPSAPTGFATLVTSVPASPVRTVYARVGDSFAWFAAGLLVWVVFPLVRPGRPPGPVTRNAGP